MSFFTAFFSLGYSGIVLLVTVLFMGGLAFSSLGLPERSWAWKAPFIVVLIAIFVWVTFYLADTRAEMLDALREQGGPPPDPKRK